MEYVMQIMGLPAYSLKAAREFFRDFFEHVHDHFIPHHRNNYHPYILSHRSLALMSGLLVAVKIFVISAVSLGTALPAFSSAITSENIITLTNESRKEYGLAALTESSVLAKAAQSKADDMLAKGYFAHNTPDGKTPWDFIVAAGYSYLSAGENLAVNFTESESVETAWMNSPGHKANILNKNFEEIGIGISEGEYEGHTAIFVVQMFGTPVEQQIKLADAATKVQTSAAPIPAASVSQETTKTASSPAEIRSEAPQTLGDSQTAVPAQAEVQSGNVKLDGETVVVTAQVSGPAVKVLAYFGQEAFMLSPKTDGSWEGKIALQDLAEKNASVKLSAVNMSGQASQLQLADFSAGTLENYNVSNTPGDSQLVQVLGRTIDVKAFENNFYLLFIAVLLSCLVLAIAVKKHIQHLSLIANSSFVVILATLIWWAG